MFVRFDPLSTVGAIVLRTIASVGIAEDECAPARRRERHPGVGQPRAMLDRFQCCLRLEESIDRGRKMHRRLPRREARHCARAPWNGIVGARNRAVRCGAVHHEFLPERTLFGHIHGEPLHVAILHVGSFALGDEKFDVLQQIVVEARECDRSTSLHLLISVRDDHDIARERHALGGFVVLICRYSDIARSVSSRSAA